MRKMFFSLLLLHTISVCVVEKLQIKVSNTKIGHNIYNSAVDKTGPAFFVQHPRIISIARQVQPPEAPIEERKQFSWWWWAVGVIIAIAGGMLLYVLIKRNPRKDAQ